MPHYRVRIGEHTYAADCEQTLLDSIPDGAVIKGCLKGVCRVCRCRLLAGHVIEDKREIAVGSEFLPCISRAVTDVEITPTVSRFHAATVFRKTYLSDKVLEVVLTVKKMFFNAKAVVTLKHSESSVLRSYSLVTLGDKNYDQLVVHVKLRPGGIFSTLFETVQVGQQLDYLVENPTRVQYTMPMKRLNVIGGGSGMGAALSRAQELVIQYNIREVLIYAINRNELSDYHHHCVENFKRHIDCKVTITNIPFLTWTHAGFDIANFIDFETLTIGVGSEQVIDRLKILPCSELESFG